MSDNCPSEDVIDEYALKRLPPGEVARVDRHLRSCERCAKQLAATRVMIEALRKKTEEEGGPDASGSLK